MYFVYILYSESYDKFYIGSSKNPITRLEKHNASYNRSFTHKFQPWEIIKSFQINNKRSDAIRIENFIKKMKSTQFIKKLIDDPSIVIDISTKLNITLHN